MRSLFSALIVVAGLFVPSGPLHGENWTRFRGPNGQGKTTENNLPLQWSKDSNIAWKSTIPGQGWSSPIVWDDHVFLTTATEDGASCRVIGIDRVSGEILWNTEVHRQVPGPKRAQNSYATPTPVTDGERVYAAFYDGTIVAVDLDGNLVWKNKDVDFHSLHGLGASPILAGGLIIMPFDGSSRDEQRVGWKEPWDQAVLLAVDKETGDTKWRGKRGLSRVGHVTPILIGDEGVVVSAGGDRVQAHDAKTGERIWSIYSQGEGVTPSPVLGEGLIFTSSGFEEPTIRAIRPDGHGDVTESHIVWEQKRGVPALPSPLYVEPFLYTITRDNILHCIDAKTGEIVWQERLDGNYSASPLLADGRIYLTSEEGVTTVLDPGPQYKEITTNKLEGKTMASIAVSRGNFFIRTGDSLYCIGDQAGAER
ncbi:PQQ-binding-like beta-propeller repeat protein [Roseiconus nitratireducens]|uniref:PQQ-binding-like beta-propeller repeat protein n=1 Tax=Roseiconus nitratireducens TaxID=2605748 RepID=A0A5M6CUS7_9BACT|nr:PQQ-binding-like beta-propeller repeat protein [Roseiconus nitratireducens]KAA5538716.1 PQQ-binding-like beta-propeller repeat protein [Roseiconus nitratireducens]